MIDPELILKKELVKKIELNVLTATAKSEAILLAMKQYAREIAIDAYISAPHTSRKDFLDYHGL